jgi:hypothetical protein
MFGVAMSGKAAAAALAQRWGLHDVAPADLRELAERGLIRVVLPGEWPLYDPDDFTAVEELRRLGDDRRAWWKASINRWDAAELLGLSFEAFDAAAARNGLRPGRADRYRRTDVLALRHERSRS